MQSIQDYPGGFGMSSGRETPHSLGQLFRVLPPSWKAALPHIEWNLWFNFYGHYFSSCCWIPLKSVVEATFQWSWTKVSVSSLQGIAEGAQSGSGFRHAAWIHGSVLSEQHPPGVHRPETHRNSFCCSYTSGGAQVCLSPRNSPSMAVQAGLCVCMGTEVLQPQLPSLLCSGGAQHHRVTEGPSLPRPHQPLPKHQCSRPHTRDNGIVVVENMENPDSNPKCIGVLGL